MLEEIRLNLKHTNWAFPTVLAKRIKNTCS